MDRQGSTENRKDRKMADKPVWSDNEKTGAAVLVAAAGAAVSAWIGSVIQNQMKKDNGEGNN
jgi:hypothetical protein